MGRHSRHRQDIRLEMLPLIRARRPLRFRRLHRLAYEKNISANRRTPTLPGVSKPSITVFGLGDVPLEEIERLWPGTGASIDPTEFDTDTPASIFVRAKAGEILEPREAAKLPRDTALTCSGAVARDLLRKGQGAALTACRSSLLHVPVGTMED